MMYSDVIVGITISRRSFVFSQSRVKVHKHDKQSIATFHKQDTRCVLRGLEEEHLIQKSSAAYQPSKSYTLLNRSTNHPIHYYLQQSPYCFRTPRLCSRERFSLDGRKVIGFACITALYDWSEARTRHTGFSSSLPFTFSTAIAVENSHQLAVSK